MTSVRDTFNLSHYKLVLAVRMGKAVLDIHLVLSKVRTVFVLLRVSMM